MNVVEDSLSAAATLAGWAEPKPEFGRGIYAITKGPREYKHAYYYLCPWSPDGHRLVSMRYDREDPEAEICVLDTANGETSVVGKSTRWNSHSAAFQQWNGDGEILYVTGNSDQTDITTVHSDGLGGRIYPSIGLDDQACLSVDGRWLYSATSVGQMFPDDEISSRGDKGLVRMNVETGAKELVLSIEQAISCAPDPGAISPCHLYIKRVIPHPRLPRMLVNLTNALWDTNGNEASLRYLVSVNLDGTEPAFVGEIVHHPSWHPSEECVVANVRDQAGELRFGLLRRDARQTPTHIPNASGSGHPTFSPDGRWICTDGAGPNGDKIVLCDPSSGQITVVAELDCVSAEYATFKALQERQDGETVIKTLARAVTTSGKTWSTHAHPVWSRDGSAILFNADLGAGSQLYFVDVELALAA